MPTVDTTQYRHRAEPTPPARPSASTASPPSSIRRRRQDGPCDVLWRVGDGLWHGKRGATQALGGVGFGHGLILSGDSLYIEIASFGKSATTYQS